MAPLARSPMDRAGLPMSPLYLKLRQVTLHTSHPCEGRFNRAKEPGCLVTGREPREDPFSRRVSHPLPQVWIVAELRERGLERAGVASRHNRAADPIFNHVQSR